MHLHCKQCCGLAKVARVVLVVGRKDNVLRSTSQQVFVCCVREPQCRDQGACIHFRRVAFPIRLHSYHDFGVTARLAQLVSVGLEIQGPEVRTPSEAQLAREQKYELFRVKKCCADSVSVCPTPVCIRTHKNDHARTLKDPVIHVRIRWITETRKDPKYTCRTGVSLLLRAAIALPRYKAARISRKG